MIWMWFYMNKYSIKVNSFIDYFCWIDSLGYQLSMLEYRRLLCMMMFMKMQFSLYWMWQKCLSLQQTQNWKSIAFHSYFYVFFAFHFSSERFSHILLFVCISYALTLIAFSRMCRLFLWLTACLRLS